MNIQTLVPLVEIARLLSVGAMFLGGDNNPYKGEDDENDDYSMIAHEHHNFQDDPIDLLGDPESKEFDTVYAIIRGDGLDMEEIIKLINKVLQAFRGCDELEITYLPNYQDEPGLLLRFWWD